MILKRLADFQLSLEPIPSGYKKEFLTRRIRLTADGFLDGDPEVLTGEKRGAGKTERSGQVIAVPREQPQRTGGPRPRLVHDNVEYVLGLGKGEGFDPAKVAERHRLYIDLLARAAEATEESSLRAVLKFVQSSAAEGLKDSGKLTAEDDIHFLVEGQDPARIVSVEEFWRAELDRYASRKSKGGGDGEGYCLVTGDWTQVGQPMPEPIKGIPGGQMSGNMLVSINFGAAESYGLEGNRSAPVSGSASESICKGLNHLISDGNHSYRVGGDIYVYWVKGRAERDALAATKDPERDPEVTKAARLMAGRRPGEPVPESIEKLFQSFSSGLPAASISKENFNLLGLSANASRIVVRDFMERSLADVMTAQGQWLARIELEGERTPSLYLLAASLYRDAGDVPKHVPVELLRAALSGTRPPRGILSLAVARNRVSGGPYAIFNKKRIPARPRMALIKACLISEPLDTTLNALNPNHPDRAYHCGRLLFVLENIQDKAIPGLNANVTSRHYGAASTTPGVIFGSLIKDAVVAHLPKVEKTKGRPTSIHFDKQLSEVLDAIGDEFPRTLDFEGQGLFSLGYFHQRADAYRKKEIPEEMPAENVGE
jgi:CRISPR-associated protein Csd1